MESTGALSEPRQHTSQGVAMSAIQHTADEISQCRVSHARYISYARDVRTTAGKAYWLSAAREIRLQLVEALDMLQWLKRYEQ